MLKNILKLNGAQELTKNEQKTINGGITEACANAWATQVCIFTSKRTCDAYKGNYQCGKCCGIVYLD